MQNAPWTRKRRPKRFVTPLDYWTLPSFRLQFYSSFSFSLSFFFFSYFFFFSFFAPLPPRRFLFSNFTGTDCGIALNYLLASGTGGASPPVSRRFRCSARAHSRTGKTRRKNFGIRSVVIQDDTGSTVQTPDTRPYRLPRYWLHGVGPRSIMRQPTSKEFISLPPIVSRVFSLHASTRPVCGVSLFNKARRISWYRLKWFPRDEISRKCTVTNLRPRLLGQIVRQVLVTLPPLVGNLVRRTF